ncbi:hypothetical protein E8F20_13035 [Pseudomonas sp. BN415]|nr:hypothetical protein [Pseudomonas sp. BN415]
MREGGLNRTSTAGTGCSSVGANSFAEQAEGLPKKLAGAAALPIANEFAPTRERERSNTVPTKKTGPNHAARHGRARSGAKGAQCIAARQSCGLSSRSLLGGMPKCSR